MAERRGVEYQQVESDYMEKRELRSGAAGWVLLAGLGVAYVISGDFAGWNFGLAEGGWGGLLIATILMATMYTCMVFGLAELSSTISTAGGGYGFARRALGPWGGFLTGTAILIEYAIAPAAIVCLHRRLRRVARPVRHHFRLAGLPRLLRDLRRRAPGRRRRGAEGHLRHHRDRRRRPAGVRVRHGRRLRLLEPDQHRARREQVGLQRVPPVRLRRDLGRVPVRDLVLPGHRGRPAGRRGDRQPQARHAEGPDRRHGRPARVRRADAHHRAGRRRRQHDHGLRQPAAGRDRPGQGRRRVPRRLRQLHRPRRPDRQLLLDHLRLLAPAVRALPRRIPAEGALGHQLAQGAVDRADRARRRRLPARRRSPRTARRCSTSPCSAPPSPTC